MVRKNPPIQIHSRTAIEASVIDEIRQTVSRHTSLENIINWGLEQNPPRLFKNSVQQDEFTVDVILPYNEHLYLVYDVT